MSCIWTLKVSYKNDIFQEVPEIIIRSDAYKILLNLFTLADIKIFLEFLTNLLNPCYDEIGK